MPLKLNLGCGGRPEPGWVNHDAVKHSRHVDVWWNLEGVWPKLYQDALGSLVEPGSILSGSQEGFGCSKILFSRLKARDVLEHIPPNLFFHVMNQAWDMLEPGGVFEIQVPEWGSYNALVDPTHWRGFHLDSFDILDPTTRIGRKNKFYGLKPWKLLTKSRIPNSTVNLEFSLARC